MKNAGPKLSTAFPSSPCLDRRQVLKALGFGSILAALPEICLSNEAQVASVWDQKIKITRPDDLLDFKLLLRNVEPALYKRKVVLRRTAQIDAFIGFEFPGQHIAEEALYETDPIPSGKLMQARIAHPTVLVFEVNRDEFYPLELEGIEQILGLDQKQAEINQRPGVLESRVESPYRMFIQPGQSGDDWSLQTYNLSQVWEDNRSRRTKVPLTHWALRSSQNPSSRDTTFRPFWTADFPDSRRSDAADRKGGFLSSFREGPADRRDISRTFSGLRTNCGIYENVTPPIPTAQHLALSTLGSWMRSEVGYSPPRGCDLKAWVHYGSFGRDHFAKVERKGFLWPFGIKAILTVETERRMQSAAAGQSLSAYLIQKRYIKIVPPYRVQYYDLEMPFGILETLTHETPTVDRHPASVHEYANYICRQPTPGRVCETVTDTDIYNSNMFWVTVDGRLFEFEFEGVDHERHRIRFSQPAIFVPDQKATEDNPKGTIGNNGLVLDEVRTALEEAWSSHPERSEAKLHRQTVSVARPISAGDTSVEVDSIDFVARDHPIVDSDERIIVPFVARIDTFTATTPSLRSIVGNDSAVRFGYRDQGNVLDPDSDANGTYAKVVPEAGRQWPSAEFAGKGVGKVGGVATPSLDIIGLSRRQGLLGGQPPAGGVAPAMAAGGLTLDQFFNENAKLLGGITLPAILAKVLLNERDSPFINYKIDRKNRWNDPPPGVEVSTWPSATLNTLDGDAELPVLGDNSFVGYPDASLTAEVKWDTDKLEKALIFDPTKRQPGDADYNSRTKLSLRGEVIHDLLSGNTTYYSKGELNNFFLKIPQVDQFWLGIQIKRMVFESGSGKKSRFDADIGDIFFGGDMSFVENFREQLKDLFGSWRLEFLNGRLRISSGFKLEPITLGAFSIYNFGFRYGVSIPLDGDPLEVLFQFAERDEPFLLAGGPYGGGGFFGTLVTAEGPKEIEFSLEFGAIVGVNFSVASGQARIMAGIYYRLSEDNTLLEGFVRTAGRFNVFGIGTLSLVIYLGLRYQNSVAYGTVLVRVKVKIGFVKIERRFRDTRRISGKRRAAAPQGIATDLLHVDHDDQGDLGQLQTTFEEEWTLDGWKEFACAYAN